MALRCGKCQYRAKRTDGYRCNYRQHASGLPQLQSLQKPDAVGRIPKDGREYAGGSYER